ncbi:MAG TPA: hypothetical protein VGG68_06970 [Caulobacteraceae bacterium]
MFSDNFARAQAPRNLDIGLVLGGAFGAIGKHWAPFVVYLAVLVWAPNAIFQFVGTPVAPKLVSLDQIWAWYAQILLFVVPQVFILGPVFAALVAWTTAADASRGPVDARAAILAVGSQFPWLVILNVLIGIAVFFGAMLLLVPGIMVLLAFYVAIPACVVEGLTPLAAISRSRFLTRGQRWRLFGLLIVIILVSIGFGIIASLVTMMAGLNLAVTRAPAVIVASVVLNGVSTLFGAAIVGSAYVELAGIKGGGNVQQTAEVFA